MEYASCIAQLAATAQAFLEQLQVGTQPHMGMLESAGWWFVNW